MTSSAQEKEIPDSKAPAIGVLERGLSILESFTKENPVQKLHEISTRTGLDKATISRALKTLVLFNYLQRLPDGTYIPGPANLRLAALYRTTSSFVSRIEPALDAISRRTGQTASFFIRSQDQRVCIARDRTERGVQSFLEVGASIPLLSGGSAARVLTAFTAPHSEGASEVINNGYYVSWGEMHRHMASVAIPVLEADGTFLGAIAITGMQLDLTVARLEEFARMAASEIRAIGLDTTPARL